MTNGTLVLNAQEHAGQSSLASRFRAHPLQSRRTHLASSEWQCSSAPVVLLHPSRWRAISNETPIIHFRPTDSAILQPRSCRQAGLSSLRRQSLEQSPYTSHFSTVAHGFSTASYDFSLAALLTWLNYLTLWASILLWTKQSHGYTGHIKIVFYSAVYQLPSSLSVDVGIVNAEISHDEGNPETPDYQFAKWMTRNRVLSPAVLK